MKSPQVRAAERAGGEERGPLAEAVAVVELATPYRAHEEVAGDDSGAAGAYALGDGCHSVSSNGICVGTAPSVSKPVLREDSTSQLGGAVESRMTNRVASSMWFVATVPSPMSWINDRTATLPISTSG
jgi:hypothetical protein